MGRINHRSGNLFDAPKRTVLVHACNTRGVWGSGVAAEFKRRYPEAFTWYHSICAQAEFEADLRGSADILDGPDYEHAVGVLYTSKSFGAQVDPPEMILQATAAALHTLLLERPKGDYHSPRFNSGLFRVPWVHTEALLESALALYPDATWTVWTP